MRRCTVKPAEIGHALKRRPCWEGQTRLIPFVFYMLSFQAFLKPWRYTAKAKTVKRTLLQKVQSYLQFWRNAERMQLNSVFFPPSCSLQPSNSCFTSLNTIFYVLARTFKPCFIPLETTGFSTVIYIKLWWNAKDLQRNQIKL